MNYDDFKATFLEALKDSGLPTMGPQPAGEVLDLRSTERTVTVYVEPIDRDVGRPFHVSGAISWRWDALQAARTATTEEDLLTELLGQDEPESLHTELPWLRVDIKLRAGLEFGKAVPMPTREAWLRWSREATGRLEAIERLVSEERVRETTTGQLAILAWQGEPELRVLCNPAGELRLDSVTVSAFQIIHLPRAWSDSEREPDEHPYAPLAAMFRRIKAALYAWGEGMDHLR
jgi:hypothetical protein